MLFSTIFFFGILVLIIVDIIWLWKLDREELEEIESNLANYQNRQTVSQNRHNVGFKIRNHKDSRNYKERRENEK